MSALQDLDLPSNREEYLLYQELQRRLKRRRLSLYYPETGPLRRERYPKHLEFFTAGRTRRERLFMAANRVGKTEGVGGYETTLHLTGRYPDWWPGYRFDRPIKAWGAGDTSKTVRDIIQDKLLGPLGQYGTGLIPAEDIQRLTQKAQVPDAIETIIVRHQSGGASTIQLKSYDQRREAFQGTEQDLIWLDEEAPLDIYAECLLRTMTTGGRMLCTFTPLMGLTEMVLSFMPGGKLPEDQDKGKFVISATWDDAPHLSDEEKEELWKSIPLYQRDARSKGIPQLGSGAIYPVLEEDVVVKPFEIPPYWPKAYGFDVGWNRTAAIWCALDRDADVAYLWSEHYRGQAEPSVHADAIRARGEWIFGAIDPAARGRSQEDGARLYQTYIDLGLNLIEAENAVEAGIHEVYQRLSSGRLKVFDTLENWLGEYRIYRRDEKGKVVKMDDHLMDATRYLVMSGLDIARTKPVARSRREKGSWKTV
jgi:phage terminase large subunit-like protein